MFPRISIRGSVGPSVTSFFSFYKIHQKSLHNIPYSGGDHRHCTPSPPPPSPPPPLHRQSTDWTHRWSYWNLFTAKRLQKKHFWHMKGISRPQSAASQSPSTPSPTRMQFWSSTSLGPGAFPWNLVTFDPSIQVHWPSVEASRDAPIQYDVVVVEIKMDYGEGRGG